VSFSKPNIIRFSPGYGGTITMHLADQFEVVLVDNLGPGNGGATPFLVQQWIYFCGKCATQHLPNSKSLTEALNVNRYQTSFKIPLLTEKSIILTSYQNIRFLLVRDATVVM